MPEDWSEGKARGLIALASAMLAACVLLCAGRFAAHRGWIGVPELPWGLGTIALWTFLAFGLLFALDRGYPRETVLDRRLWAMRRALLLAVLGTFALFFFWK